MHRMRASAAAILVVLAAAAATRLRAQSALDQAAALSGDPSWSQRFEDRMRALDHRLLRGVSKTSAPALLSQTGLYSDIRAKKIDPANDYFEPQFPLWSDGAAKSRWVRLPPGAAIDTSNMDRWVFPVGTKFWKEFRFQENGEGASRRVETRLIEKTGPDEWLFASYVWNADESEATLAPDAGIHDDFPIGGGVRHDIPSQVQCVRCHSRGGDRILGFDALQLSSARETPGRGIDLNELSARGRLTRAPERAPVILAASPAARRAIGYFHANCGLCHNPQGFAAPFTPLSLRYQIDGVHSESEIPAVATAVGKLTADFQIPGQAQTFFIKPHDPAASAIFYRMSHRGAEQMPPIGTKRVDDAGIAAVLAWINELR